MSRKRGSRPGPGEGEGHRISVDPPFRLDLTVTALRRLPTNVVDILTPEGEYIRALRVGSGAPFVVRVRQSRPDRLAVDLSGSGSEEDRRRVLNLVRRTLGVDRDLSSFYRAARRLAWLRPLLKLGEGVRPPRYPTLWEASVKVVLFQQISLQAASTITRRLVEAAGNSMESYGQVHYTFPSAERVLELTDSELRAFGISPSKAATLRRVGEAIGSGELIEEEIEGLPSPEAARVLEGIKGIGPWSATVILLRGFGRLDLFPMNDVSVASNLELVGAGRRIEVSELMERLGDQRGMLYYYLLLARLEDRGVL